EQLKQHYEITQNDVSVIKGKYDANVEQLEKIAVEIKENYEISDSEIATKIVDVVEEGKKLKEDVTELEKIEQILANLKKTQEEVEASVKSKTKERDTLTEILQKKQNDFTGRLAAFNTQMEKIPEDLQRIEILQNKLNEKEIIYNKMLATWEAAQERLKKAEKASTEMSTALESAKKQLVNVEEKLLLAE